MAGAEAFAPVVIEKTTTALRHHSKMDCGAVRANRTAVLGNRIPGSPNFVRKVSIPPDFGTALTAVTATAVVPHTLEDGPQQRAATSNS